MDKAKQDLQLALLFGLTAEFEDNQYWEIFFLVWAFIFAVSALWTTFKSDSNTSGNGDDK